MKNLRNFVFFYKKVSAPRGESWHGTRVGAECHLITSLVDPSSWVTGTTGKTPLQNIEHQRSKISNSDMNRPKNEPYAI